MFSFKLNEYFPGNGIMSEILKVGTLIVFGLNGILFAQPVADILVAIITISMALYLHRTLSSEKASLFPVISLHVFSFLSI